ncbi:P-loop containing nucleoside triphosphate hydrolase protein [Hypoxylon sp. NC1633]|nr:P-loop containing nucleoside triphosphate hydrolase protein [Hypoxylon sp. NC1633]
MESGEGYDFSEDIDLSVYVGKWYSHRCPAGCCPSRWSEYQDEFEENECMQDVILRTPLIQRFSKGTRGWQTESVSVQDSVMRQILLDVLGEHSDFDPVTEGWTFKAPFRPLVHSWDLLRRYGIYSTDDPAEKLACKTLLEFLAPILEVSLSSSTKFQETGKIEFVDIWHLFKPKDLVITKVEGVDVVCRVLKYKQVGGDQTTHSLLTSESFWIIDAEYVDWNGEESGYKTVSVRIDGFDKYRRITSLPIFPTSYLSDEAATGTALIERGRKFEKMRGCRFMVCKGTKITLETKTPQMRSVAGRVCVDAYAYYHSQNLVKPTLRTLQRAYEKSAGAAKKDKRADATDGATTSPPPVSRILGGRPPAERSQDLRPLTDDECLMASPWVVAFDFKSKDWSNVCVDDLEDVTWNDQAFKKLVLPDNQKEITWDFIEGKRIMDASHFDDFVENKGRGLIILMLGPPGVGKTFTAEAVAEKARVPLYAMSAGDLGTKLADVEEALERALGLCHMWNAMLLLDEADVFMSTRRGDSLDRNELVSIFLRLLEYYEGTMFLTTNRVDSMDHAFQSRIDLFLPYGELSSHTRREIWENFLDRAGRENFCVTDKDLDTLSEFNLDGREIKNLVKNVQMLGGGHKIRANLNDLRALANNRIRALETMNFTLKFT